jgi:hypothetical protein
LVSEGLRELTFTPRIPNDFFFLQKKLVSLPSKLLWEKCLHNLPWVLPTKLQLSWPNSKMYFNWLITNKNCLWRHSNFIQAKRRFLLRNWSIRNKNCLWRPCLLTDRNDMNIIIEDLSYILSTMFRFIWPSGFRGEDLFLNCLTRNKNCLLRSCVLTARDDMNNLYRGNVIDTFFHVSAHLANRFQRRRLFLNWPTRNNNCLRRP